MTRLAIRSEAELVICSAALPRGKEKMTDQQYPPPTAPPRNAFQQPPPPTYEDVLDHDAHRPGAGARIANTLTSSMAFAGEVLGTNLSGYNNIALSV